jgi:hypothetical protein
MTVMTYTGRLVVTSCWCGIALAIPEDLHWIATRHKHHTVYCPLGHKFVYGNTTEERLAETEAELKKERQRRVATTRLLRHEERSHAATRGHVTRKRKQLERVSNGVCPCCNRSFTDLRKHMKTKHPEYKGQLQ